MHETCSYISDVSLQDLLVYVSFTISLGKKCDALAKSSKDIHNFNTVNTLQSKILYQNKVLQSPRFANWIYKWPRRGWIYLILNLSVWNETENHEVVTVCDDKLMMEILSKWLDHVSEGCMVFRPGIYGSGYILKKVLV